MARDHARIVCAIWRDADFVGLDPLAQRMFMLLLSQPKLSLCGALDYTPERWASLSSGTTAGDVERAVDALEQARFVVVDRPAQELVVRSFVRHDGLCDSPNLVQAMWKAWAGLHSEELRWAVVTELPEVAFADGFGGPPRKGYATPPEALALRAVERSPKGSPKGSGNPSATPAPTPSPTPTPNPPVPLEQPQSLALVPSPPAKSADDVEVVFAAWVDASGRTGRTVFTPERRRLIQRQLKHYPVNDLVDAVRGWRHSAHHRGENDRNTVYDDLELLLRDAKHIEMFRDLERDPPGRPVPKGIQGITAWLARTGS